MSTTRSSQDLEIERSGPADPPPYWWRRAEENRMTVTLTLVSDEPEDLDPSDLVSDEDETLPPGRTVPALSKS